MKRVYFIRPIGMQGPVKIGCSSSPDGRKRSLASWSPFPLEIVCEIEGGHDIERRFHAKFAGSHRSHEWFDWTPELARVMSEIRVGSFDVAELPDPAHLPRKKADRSYCTPAWRYKRSVMSRLQALRVDGLPWTEASEIYKLRITEIGDEEIEAIRAHVEPLLASWRERFPRNLKARAA